MPVDATKGEIRTAFVALSKKYHPDVSKSKDTTITFSQINEAYSVLSSPTKRYQYDLKLYVMKSNANKAFGHFTQSSVTSPFGSYHSKASPFTYARDFQYYDNLSESEWTELYNKSNPKPNHYRVVKWLVALTFVGTAVHAFHINAAHKQFKQRSDEAHRNNVAAYTFVRERAKNSTVQEQLNRLSSEYADEH